MLKNILLFCCVLASLCVSADTLITLDGKKYNDYEIDRPLHDGLSVIHSEGVAVIPYKKLPIELQKKYANEIPKLKEKEIQRIKNYKQKLKGHYVKIMVKKLSNQKVKIHGNTNFPPNTKFELILEEQVGAPPFRFRTHTHFNILADQSWEIKLPVEEKDELLPGVYHITIKTIDPSKQPKNVRNILGYYGEKLKGKSIIGIGHNLYFKHSIFFTIGEDAKEKQIKRHQHDEIRIKLCKQLEELLSFKDDEDFKYYGFGRGGKYYNWLKKSEEIRTSITQKKYLPIYIKVASVDLITVGIDYIKHGDEKKSTQILLNEIRKTIRYDKYIQFNNRNNRNKRKFRKEDYNRLYIGMSFANLQNVLKDIKDIIYIKYPYQTYTCLIHGNKFIVHMEIKNNKLDTKELKNEDITIQEFRNFFNKLKEKYGEIK